MDWDTLTLVAACLILIAALGPDLIFALRTGRVKVGKVSLGRKRDTVSRKDHPRQYWLNVCLGAFFVALASACLIGAFFFPGYFR